MTLLYVHYMLEYVSSMPEHNYIIQTVTNKTIQAENHIFENFLRIDSILFVHISVETKVEASN